MPTMRRAINAYGQASETLAPAQQIVLLYEGAIRRIKEARHAIEARRINDRYLAVRKATAIIEGLQSCLDHARGGGDCCQSRSHLLPCRPSVATHQSHR